MSALAGSQPRVEFCFGKKFPSTDISILLYLLYLKHQLYLLTILKASVSTVVMRYFFTNNPLHLFQINLLHVYRCQTTIDTGFMHASHNYDTGTSCRPAVSGQLVSPSIHLINSAQRRPTRARCTWATTMAQARHAGPSIHLIKARGPQLWHRHVMPARRST
jgi:hypothetical protein